jgi:hypothetical protein
MDEAIKFPYETPELRILGSVVELTAATSVPEKCTGSADATLPRQPAAGGDFLCGPF